MTSPVNSLKKTLHHIAHRIGPKGRTHASVLKRVASTRGLVYFGDVDQHHDDHEIIRGLTASASHHDSHYIVGSVGGYDVAIVDRCDGSESHDRKLTTSHVVVLQIRLKNAHDIPHILIVPRGQKIPHFERTFMTPHVQPVPLSASDGYTHEFSSRYNVLTVPTHFEYTKELIDAKISQTLAAHFWPIAIELDDNMMYVYTDDTKLTTQLLDTLIENGLWLAGQIDSK
jgi:hypothetical protein